MTATENRLVNNLRNAKDQAKAVEVAVKVILEFLSQNRTDDEKSGEHYISA